VIEVRQWGHRNERSGSRGPNDLAIISHISLSHRGQMGRLWDGCRRSGSDTERPLHWAKCDRSLCHRPMPRRCGDGATQAAYAGGCMFISVQPTVFIHRPYVRSFTDISKIPLRNSFPKRSGFYVLGHPSIRLGIPGLKKTYRKRTYCELRTNEVHCSIAQAVSFPQLILRPVCPASESPP
jgi:hypothetical protein